MRDRPTCETSLSFDLRILRHLLYPNNQFVCSWTRAGQPVARVDVTVGVDEVMLEWPGGGQTVALAYTPRHQFPNQPARSVWVWLVCPEADCSRRCKVLYRSGDSSRFACRVCRGLAHAIVRTSPRHRTTWMQRSLNLVDPAPERGRYVHTRGYTTRLNQALATAERWAALLARNGRHGKG
jgi:hypothetical protein